MAAKISTVTGAAPYLRKSTGSPTRFTIVAPVSAGGAATVYSPYFSGRVVSIQYVPDGTTPYDNTLDVTVTLEADGRAVLAKTNVAAAFTNQPREATHDGTGTAMLYAAGGTAVLDEIRAANDRLKFVLAQGGASKTGSFVVTVD